MLPNGGRFITADRKHAHPSLKSPLAGRALGMLRTLAREGLTPNPLSLTFQENIVLFQQGRMAMNGESFTRAVQLEDSAKSRVAGKMAYATMPSQKLGPEPPVYYGSAWTYAIDRNSKVKDAAWEYIRFITSPEIQKLNAIKTGNGATSPSVYDDAEVLRANPAARAVKAALEKGYTHPFPVPQITQLQQVVHEEVQQAILGRKSPEASACAMFERIERALQ